LIISILEQGLIYGIMTLGVYVTYKILDFPDLTVDGSYPMGAAVTASLIDAGVNPLLTIPLAILAGASAGLITGLIHVKLRVRDLLAGIITMTALFSINLHIAGRANVPIFTKETIFKNNITERVFFGAISPFKTLVIVIIVSLVVKLIFDAFLSTKAGYMLRAVGDNDMLVTTLAVDKGKVKIIGLVIANALVALSGCIMCQQQRYFDITMGTGTMVMGLAAVIIGVNLFKNISFMKATTAVIVGSIAYKACVALAISMGLSPNDMKLITALLFLAILAVSNRKKRRGEAEC